MDYSSKEFQKDVQKHRNKQARKEERLQKKGGQIGKRAGWCLGIGIGVLIARLVAPLLFGEFAPNADSAFAAIGWGLVFYGGVSLLSLLLFRKHVLKINLVMSYLIMPSLILWIMVRFKGG